MLTSPRWWGIEDHCEGNVLRFVLAISALVLSGILLLLGIGHATFLAGPRLIEHSAPLTASSKLFVIDPEQLEAVPGQANIVVRDAEPFVGYGQRRDVAGWIAPFEHSVVRVNAEQEELQLQSVRSDRAAAAAYIERTGAEPGVELVAPSPAGSDLWLDERSLTAEQREPAPASPEGEQNGETESELATQMVRMPVSLDAKQSVLVALTDPGPNAELTIEWVQNRRMPLVGPLLVAGGVLAVVGIVLYLLAVDHDRRGLGPRRGRKGPLLGIRNQFTRRRAGSAPASGASPKTNGGLTSERRRLGIRRGSGVIGLGMALTLAITGCSPAYWPDLSAEQEAEGETPAPEAPQNLAPVPLTNSQIQRIVSEVAEIAAAADDALEPSELSKRFRGDALLQRETNYTIRSAVSDYEVVVPTISDELLGYQLVQSTETWPRTMLVVVDSGGETAEAETEPGAEENAEVSEVPAEGSDEAEVSNEEAPSLALILTQVNPHENYLVSRVIALRGGISMPEAAPAEVGTAMLANDLTTLRLPPAEVGAAYAALLAGNTEIEQSALFNLEGDTLISRSGAAWVAQATEAAAAAGQDIVYSVTAAQTESRVISLSTGVGGALVALTINENRSEVPAEGSNWRPTISGSMAALSGLSGRQESVSSVVAHQLLFYVPSGASNDKIQLLGYTSDLVGASAG